MPDLSDDLKSPRPPLNGHSPSTGLSDQETLRDQRVVYYVFGVIFIAFLLGVSLLAITILSDWQ